MLYLLIKWVHVLAAITALGANITYGLWLARAARQPHALPFTLRTVRVLDSRLANPAYGVSLITGVAMMFLGDWPLTTPWLLLSIILYALVFLLGILVYAPVFRKQVALAEDPGPSSPEYAAVARQSTLLGIIVTLMVVVIVFLMVVKPPLWG
jgi:uncharacterized membrane protein